MPFPDVDRIKTWSTKRALNEPKALAAKARISIRTLYNVLDGRNVKRETIDAVAKALRIANPESLVLGSECDVIEINPDHAVCKITVTFEVPYGSKSAEELILSLRKAILSSSPIDPRGMSAGSTLLVLELRHSDAVSLLWAFVNGELTAAKVIAINLPLRVAKKAARLRKDGAFNPAVFLKIDRIFQHGGLFNYERQGRIMIRFKSPNNVELSYDTSGARPSDQNSHDASQRKSRRRNDM